MKPKTISAPWPTAFTVIELLVMVLTVAMLFVLLFSGVPRVRKEARLKQCSDNLKQIGLAFRIWSSDSSSSYPQQATSHGGGSMESITNGQVFHTFQVLSNELTGNAKLLICPADTRTPALDIQQLANANISYFVGVNANDTEPNLLLAGDRNLTNGPLTSTRLLTLTTNSTPGWTEAIHNLVGNIGLADGSVQNYSSAEVLNAIRFATNLLSFP